MADNMPNHFLHCIIENVGNGKGVRADLLWSPNNENNKQMRE